MWSGDASGDEFAGAGRFHSLRQTSPHRPRQRGSALVTSPTARKERALMHIEDRRLRLARRLATFIICSCPVLCCGGAQSQCKATQSTCAAVSLACFGLFPCSRVPGFDHPNLCTDALTASCNDPNDVAYLNQFGECFRAYYGCPLATGAVTTCEPNQFVSNSCLAALNDVVGVSLDAGN